MLYLKIWGIKEGLGEESQLHGGIQVCVYMYRLMTVEINDHKPTMNVLLFSQTCEKGRQHSENSVL
jgi:hypothetical protein